jgi:hypothetical protein
VAIFDVPVDFAKYYVVPNMDDVNAFKLALRHASAEADLFQDYQGQFPAEFTTYDALHPNLYGARLHAFDMISRMNEGGLLARKYDAGQILAAFKDLGAEALESYGQQLAHVRSELKTTVAPSWNWASLDITAPLYSLRWLNNLATNYESNPEKVALIYSLFLQLRYLDVAPATKNALNSAKSLGDGFFQAFSYEGNLARNMNDVFVKNVREVVRERHNLQEIPAIVAASRPSTVKSYEVLRKCGPIRLTAANGTTSESGQNYFIGEERVALESPDREGRMLRRTDVFGDGSFLLLEANAGTGRWFLPYKFICPSNGYGVESLPGKSENGLTN